MLRALAVIALVACGPRASAPATVGPAAPRPAVPRLLAPPLSDPDVRGAAYLTAVALQLQPAWHQFLEDCRLRLPAEHPLNRMTLATTADLEIDGKGHLVAMRIAPSGSRDFDHAIKDVVGDASPLPAPPRELWSDDDHVHLTWLFARDRRQAGPATAQVDDVELPLLGVVDKRIAENDLPRAARRILRAPPSGDRIPASQRVMVAALRSGLAVSDGTVRRAAIDAIARAKLRVLAPEVRQLLTSTTDTDLRMAAMQASAALGDVEAVPILVEQLEGDLHDHPRLAVAEGHALFMLNRRAELASVIEPVLAETSANATAIELSRWSWTATAKRNLTAWLESGDARVRAAACSVLPNEMSWPRLLKGLMDRDAGVRAACTEASTEISVVNPTPKQLQVFEKVFGLVRDRDSRVRARAIATAVQIDSTRLPDASSDRAAEVRAAFADALAQALVTPERLAALRALADDRDPDVRAAAWNSYVKMPADSERARLAAHAASDAAPQVRRSAVPAISSEDTLLHLATSDDDADVRTAALVELAGRRGRAASTDLLLQRLADAPAGSAERVRTALAWLLAP